jgi:outer membrane receptor protein involved in Fe transport
MRSLLTAVCWFALVSAAFAQSDRGTITGTISDPAGAVVASAPVVARNIETGAVYSVAASATGNYTIPELPAGTYELTIAVPGFKKLIRPGLIIQAAQTIRVDAALEVGNASESVTVQAEAPLLKTESGELSQTIETQVMDALPLLEVGASSSGIRNPYNIVALLPGSYYQPVNTQFTTGPTVRINGGATASETFLVDGMDGTNLMSQGINQQTAPGMDSIQEWTVQTSNYSAEFGQAGSAVMNVTMKSGTNQYHGSAYDYFQNEVLNSGQPFTVQPGSPNEHIRPAAKRNDYGITLGGPIRIPKLYDGHNKTFFFFNWEQYLNTTNALPGAQSIPTAAYRNGDFSAAIAAAGTKTLGTDPLGRPIIANTIYDPNTQHLAPNGQIITDPFMNNRIPKEFFDPVSLKIQNLMPLPFCVAGAPCNANGVVNNWQNTEPYTRDTEIPSLKLDHIIGPKDKLSFYWSRTLTYSATYYGADGLPQPISYSFGGAIYTHRERLNYDHTISPTLLLHLGAGFDADDLGRPSVTQDYDICGQLGLCSSAFVRPITFPNITGLSDPLAGGFGSLTQPLGPIPRTDSLYQQFESIASLTWVKENHTFKFGGELRNGGVYSQNFSKATFAFSGAQTAMPYLVNTSTGKSVASVGPNNIGFPYASFLLGAVDTADIDPYADTRFGKHSLGFYAQDSWKVTRKLTLDVGLRYDYSIYYKEQYGRSPNFAPNLPNPTAGGHPGAVTYQAICHCDFAKNYPWGFAPRVGMAYQVGPKTVLRGGFAMVYSGTDLNGASGSASAVAPLGPASPGQSVMTWGQGVTANGAPLTPAQIAWPNFSPGFYPIAGVIPGQGPQYYDPNAGRPARQYQWSFSVQREVAANLVVEASYIGNRGMWWPTSLAAPPAPGGATGQLVNYNYLSTSILNQYGLSLNNQADLTTLLAHVGDAAAGRFQNKLPFAGFPLTATVAQSLRPFPQFNTNCTGLTPSGPCPLAAPLGDTWYDSLQLSANKRFSHGLQFTFGFTWQKSLDTFGGTPDVQNRALAKAVSSLDQPFATRVGFTYTLPKVGPGPVSYVVRDWFFNGFVYYASGIPLLAPTANTAGYPANLATGSINNITFQTSTPQLRVPGQSPYLKDLNCHCYDPNTTILLNPAAWTNPAPGQYGGAYYYSDFRGERRPVENLAIGRQFRIRERVSLALRAEFQNIFNRTYLNNPSFTNPQTAPVCKLPTGSNGACSPGLQVVSGFGSVNTSTLLYQPRTGQLVARFEF